MREKNTIKVRKFSLFVIIALFVFVLLLSLNVYAQSTYIGNKFNTQTYQPSFSTYYSTSEMYEMWPILRDSGECSSERQDFIVNIRPGSCMPAVVRSDLLEEQNVRVYCQVDAVKLNPLIDVSWIKGINFKAQEYPDEVLGAGFHPSRAALKINNKFLTEPILNNLGYVVVYLKSMPEKDMPESVELELTGYLRYDMENAFGTGKVQYYLFPLDDEEWDRNYEQHGFWKGKGYVRVDWIHEDSAKISLYRDVDTKISSFELREGQVSDEIYLPGYHCLAGVEVRLDELSVPEISALLEIDGTKTWVRKGSRFLDKCRVLEIDETTSEKQVKIKCYGKIFDLILRGRPASFAVDGEDLEKYEGEMIDGWHVVYIGKAPDTITELEKDERDFVVLAKSKPDLAFEDKIPNIKKWINNYIERGGKGVFEGWISESLAKLSPVGVPVEFKDVDTFQDGVTKAGWWGWFLEERGRKGLRQYKGIFDSAPEMKVLINTAGHNSENEIEFNGLYELEDKKLGEKISNYISWAKVQAKELADDYTNEKSEDNQYFGALALGKLANLIMGNLGQKKTAEELYKKLIEIYPDSDLASEARSELDRLGIYDYSAAEEIIATRDGYHNIKLIDIKKPDFEDAYADFTVQTLEEKYPIRVAKGDFLDENQNLRLDELKDDRVVITYFWTEIEKEISEDWVEIEKEVERKKTLEIKRKEVVSARDEYSIRLDDVYLKKEASLSLIPVMPDMESTANITFRIGIEKRAIQLTPEKTQEMIDNLDKSIKDWEGIIDGLGNLIKGFKGACFITTAYLMIKNFWSNVGGGVKARQDVMQKWYDYCEKKDDINECLLENNDKIEADIINYKKNVDEVNTYVKNLQKDKNYLDERGNINQAKLRKAYINKLSGEEYGLSDDEIASLQHTSFEQLRDLELAIKNSGVGSKVKEIGVSDKENTLNILGKLKKESEERETMYGKWKVSSAYTGESLAYHGNIWNEADKDKYGTKMDIGEPFQAIEIEEGGYLAVLEIGKGDKYSVRRWYKIEPDGKTLTLISEDDKLKKYYFKKGLSNEWKDPRVRFYGTGMFKGLAKIVPLGKEWGNEKGWYVATKPLQTRISLETLQQKKAYSENAVPQYYYIGNVGFDGKEEFEASLSGRGDDNLISIRAGSYQKISSLSEQESRNLITTAERALKSANSQYRTGIQETNILGARYDVGVSSAEVGIQCTDYMSPKDCLLMFNLCDPVLCPSSRCDAGGKYPVDNVIQSGIIGSIFLCLPNWNEGIKIPVCLSGIHAGLEGYTSILKAHRDCLQESLDTGRSVGICDEIYSIYLCEFFWRQAAPLMRIAIPSILGMLKGEGVRGGHEYLTIQESWNNLESSISYFKDYYAVEAYESFVARSTDEVGTEVCKAFISQRYPTSKNFFDNLLAPDSPVQFHAWFDEIPFSEATVPATSHYKVYYHIYAGKDVGVYYSVYLKEPTKQPVYYTVKDTIVVQTGYLSKGESLDETKDFTAPAGYKKLCVRINGQDKCGFQQVSTSFALNYLSEKYVQEQASQQIRTEEECISGTQSFLPILQPNIQEGAAEALSPDIYKRGIVRVCATDNPGGGVDSDEEEQRWVDVGYCGSENVICWLDTKSVKDVIKHKGLEEQALDDVGFVSEQIDVGDIISAEVADGILRDLSSQIESLDLNDIKIPFEGKLADDKNFKEIISLIEYIKEKGELDFNKAKALFLKFELYTIIIEKLVTGEVVDLTTTEGADIEKMVGDEKPVEEGEEPEEKITKKLPQGVEEKKEKPGEESVEVVKTEEELKEEKKEEKRFILRGDNIYHGIIDTGLYLHKVEKPTYHYYVIRKSLPWYEGIYQQIGSIGNGRIDFSEDIELTDTMHKLMEYTFDEEEEIFIKDGKEKWTLDSALAEVKTREGKYEDNIMFVYQLYKDGILTEEEFIEINGKGTFNRQEDMLYLKNLLLWKILQKKKGKSY